MQFKHLKEGNYHLTCCMGSVIGLLMVVGLAWYGSKLEATAEEKFRVQEVEDHSSRDILHKSLQVCYIFPSFISRGKKTRVQESIVYLERSPLSFS